LESIPYLELSPQSTFFGTPKPPATMLLATTKAIVNYLLAGNISLSLISPIAKNDFPEQLCGALTAIPSTFDLSPLTMKMQKLIETLDDAFDFSRQGCDLGASCESVTPLFNTTDLAAKDTGHALFAYTVRLSPSFNMYVNVSPYSRYPY
jgi:hypothetical protein